MIRMKKHKIICGCFEDFLASVDRKPVGVKARKGLKGQKCSDRAVESILFLIAKADGTFKKVREQQYLLPFCDED